MKYLALFLVFGFCCAEENRAIIFSNRPPSRSPSKLPASPAVRGLNRPLNDTRNSEGNDEGNQIQSFGDFARYYEVDLPVQISKRFGGEATDTTIELPHASCDLENQTVALDIPQEKGYIFIPTCVRVQRCGGCCYLDYHSCQPTETEIVKVKVLKAGEEVKRQRHRRRRARNTRTNYVSVDVVQHTKCGCDCKLQPSECDTKTQSYDEALCLCVCKDVGTREACYASDDHYWDVTSCQCLCHRTTPCSTGQTFDHKACRCIRV